LTWPKPGTDMGKPKLDWQRMANAYITGPDTVTKQSLAVLFHTNRTTVSLRATAEGWDKQREVFRARVAERTQDKKADVLATAGAAWDSRCAAVAAKIMDLVDQELQGVPLLINGKPVLDPDGNPIMRRMAAKDIASAAKIAQDMGKATLGENPNNNLAVTLADEVKKALV